MIFADFEANNETNKSKLGDETIIVCTEIHYVNVIL